MLSRPTCNDTLAYDYDFVAVTIPVNGSPDDLSDLLAIDESKIVGWEISGDRNGIARGSFNVSTLVGMAAATTIQIPVGVAYTPPVGPVALSKTFVESADASTVPAVVIVYQAYEVVVPG